MKYYADYYESPIGKLMLAAGEQGLAGIWIEGQKYFADSLKEQSMIWEDHALLQPAKDWAALSGRQYGASYAGSPTDRP